MVGSKFLRYSLFLLFASRVCGSRESMKTQIPIVNENIIVHFDGPSKLTNSNSRLHVENLENENRRLLETLRKFQAVERIPAIVTETEYGTGEKEEKVQLLEDKTARKRLLYSKIE